MPLRNGHKALTSSKIDKAIRRLLPAYIKLFDGILTDEKIYRVIFGCPWIAGEKCVSAYMGDVRPELLDEWAETIAQQIVLSTVAGTTGTHYPVPQSSGSIPVGSSWRSLRDTATGLYISGALYGNNR